MIKNTENNKLNILFTMSESETNVNHGLWILYMGIFCLPTLGILLSGVCFFLWALLEQEQSTFLWSIFIYSAPTKTLLWIF